MIFGVHEGLMDDSEDYYGEEGDNDNAHNYDHCSSLDLQCNEYDHNGDEQVKKK